MDNNFDSPKHTLPPCDVAKTTRVDCRSTGLFGGGALMPVILRDVELQALVESEISLPTPAREIKNVRRNVSLTQCKAIPSLLPIPIGDGFGGGGFGARELKLFVSGKIHKNIQYIENCSGYLRDYSVDVPFSCNHAVTIPFLGEKFSEKSTLTNERIFIDKKGHGADNNQSGGFTYEIYNEPIECKLLLSLVNDLDLHKNFDSWGRFRTIIEKAEVVLIFRLIQLQKFPPFPFGTENSLEEEISNQFNALAQPQLQDNQEQTVQQRIDRIIKSINNKTE